MFTYVIKPVLEIIHFIHRSSVFVLTTGYYVGRAIILVFLKICSVVRDIFAALTVIGEELYQFLCELNSSISDVSQYIRTSTNGGVNCLIEAVVIFYRHIRKFFANTRIHSKLLATKLGCFICDFFELIRNALLLIADCCWWLITLVPRFVVYFLIFIGDLIVNAITVVRKSIVYCVTAVVEDIFRLTIAVVLLILLWHNRKRLGLFVLRSFLYLKRVRWILKQI